MKEHQASLELVQSSAASAAELSKTERDTNLEEAIAKLEERLTTSLANAGGGGLPLTRALTRAPTSCYPHLTPGPAAGGGPLTRTRTRTPTPTPTPTPTLSLTLTLILTLTR